MSKKTPAHRRIVRNILLWLRRSPWQKQIIGLLVAVHNWSYHLIALFASRPGYHPKHDIQKYEQFFLQHLKATDEVLDVGCGRGQICQAIAPKVARVVGIDIVPEKIDFASKHNRRSNLKFVCGDATSYNFDHAFNAIVLSNVLEHIKDRVLFLNKLSRLAPTILIRVPMITRDWLAVYKRDHGYEYRLDDTHYIEYDRETFRSEMRLAHLTIESMFVDFGELYAVVTRRV